MDTNGHSGLPQVAVEYIDEVIRKMRWRRKVREDVRQELVDHFADALDHISGEVEREKEAQKLISEFGDAALLGKLMRRAKKRCLPWWAALIARLSEAILAATLCVVLYFAWLLSGDPTINTDYVAKYNEIVKPSGKITEDQNAAPLYDKSVKVYIPFVTQAKNGEDGNKAFNPVKTLPHAINLKEELLVREWVKDNTEVIKLWDQASRKPYFWRQYKVENNELANLKLPNLGKYRVITHLFAWDAYLQAKDGNFDKASNNLFILYKTGDHLKNQKTIIEQLVGLGYMSKANETFCRILNNYDLDENGLKIIQNQLIDLFESIDYHTSFEADLYFMLDKIQRMFVTTSFGDHLYLKNTFGMEFDDLGEDNVTVLLLYSLRNFELAKKILRHPDKKQTIADAIALYDSAVEYAKTPPYQNSDYTNQLIKTIKNNLVLNILMPAFDTVSEIGYKVEVYTEATIVIVAAHRYEMKEGFWPESLNELMCDGYIESVPIDPFSGEQLAYRKTDNSFVLYSVGTDRVDNGGKAEYDKEGNIAKWPKKEGYDAVFWPMEE